MHNSVVFEFPEDGAFLKEGRYYTLEAVSLSYRGGEKRKKQERREKGREEGGERIGGGDKFEGRERVVLRCPWPLAILHIEFPDIHPLLTTAISSRLIPPRFASHPSSFLFVSAKFIPPLSSTRETCQRPRSRRDLFLKQVERTGQPWPATTFIPAIQFLFKRIRYKGGGREGMVSVVQRVSTRREILGEGEPTFVGLST